MDRKLYMGSRKAGSVLIQEEDDTVPQDGNHTDEVDGDGNPMVRSFRPGKPVRRKVE